MPRTLWRWPRMAGILYTIAVMCLAAWLIAFVLHVTIQVVNLLLIIAVILVLWNLLRGRRVV